MIPRYSYTPNEVRKQLNYPSIGVPRVVGVADPLARDERWLRWLRMHSVNPNNTYEVTVGNTQMIVKQFATRLEVNKKTAVFEWKKYCYPDTGEVAYVPPFVVRLITPWH